MALHLIMSASYNALLAIFLYILDKKTAFSKTPYKLKQSSIGILFGFMRYFRKCRFFVKYVEKNGKKCII